MSGNASIFDPAAAGDLLTATSSGLALEAALAAGGAVPCGGVEAAGWAALTALLRCHTGRPVLLVAGNLKLQEQLQQDL